MSLIEQAAKRLEQLRQAGVELPEDNPPVRIQPQNSSPARRDALRTGAASPTMPSAPPAIPAKHVDLDLKAIAASGLLVPQSNNTQLASEYRVIKRPLISNAMGRSAAPIANGNLVMVTSSLPGEGKSFTAVNLAMSIAMELDTTVMLVDADVARPSILNMLGLPPAEGLLDVVQENSVDISRVLLRTNIEKLSLLPSGTKHPRATELLASDAMIRLLEDMSRRYQDRIIIFDSPPLLITTEARALATHMGQIVLVVHAGHTTEAAVKEAIAAIDSCPVKMTILNQVRQSAAEGYGYGYSLSYGYGHEK
jgi:protein-tyrosine kinase